MFFIACLAETNRAPFDLTEGESELVAGYNVEYASMPFALFFLAEYTHIILMSFMFAILFLGGWAMPFSSSDIWLFIKASFIVFSFIWVRTSFPRLRYDQLMHLVWKSYLPLSLGLVLMVNCVFMGFKWTTSSPMYLSVLICLPFLAILHISLVQRFDDLQLNKVALGWTFTLLLYFVCFNLHFINTSHFQFGMLWAWVSSAHTNLSWGSLTFALDGIALFFTGLSLLLIALCVLMSWYTVTHFKKEFLLFLFCIELFLIGVFTVLDILGFYILFEAILIPMFLIIGIWGSRAEKVKAAFYFFFYTLIGSLLMLVSIFKLYALTGTTHYATLLTIELPPALQYWLFLGFFISLATKIPMVPFHIWLPQAHVEAPVAGSVLLAGILLKLGGYGFIRFAFPLFPIASEYFAPPIIVLSVIAILYAGFTTCRQTDIKRFIAYSSVAHMGLVTLALFTHSIEGLIASIALMLAHGLVSAGLFMTSAMLYTHHHSRTIKYFRGLALTMPLYSTINLLLILANIGFPLTFNFIAEFFSIVAAMHYSYVAGVLVCAGSLIGTVYALYFYNRIHFGSTSPHLTYAREMVRYEFQAVLPLLSLTLLLGIFPSLVFQLLNWSAYLSISL